MLALATQWASATGASGQHVRALLQPRGVTSAPGPHRRVRCFLSPHLSLLRLTGKALSSSLPPACPAPSAASVPTAMAEEQRLH